MIGDVAPANDTARKTIVDMKQAKDEPTDPWAKIIKTKKEAK